jgi:hypothetical protein
LLLAHHLLAADRTAGSIVHGDHIGRASLHAPGGEIRRGRGCK